MDRGLNSSASPAFGLIVKAMGFCVLLINSCALYGFIGVTLGFPDARSVSILSLSLLTIYCALNIKTLSTLLRRFSVLNLTLFIWSLPCAILAIQLLLGKIDLSRFVYWVGFMSLPGLLFLAGVIFGVTSRARLISIFFWICVAIVALELAINRLYIDYVWEIWTFIQSPLVNSRAIDRLAGFFPWPNETALALSIYCFAIAYADKFRLTWPSSASMAICASMIFLTGSRTSLIIFAAICLGVVAKNAIHDSRSFTYIVFGAILLFPLSFILLDIIPYISQSANGEQMLSRLSDLLSIIGGQPTDDQSANLRLKMIGEFIAIIGRSPFIGSGHDALSGLIEAGEIDNVSQVSWLQWAAEFGVPYALYGLFVVIAIFLRARSLHASVGPLKLSAMNVSFLAIILFIASFSLVDLFWLRAVAVATGIFVGRMEGSFLRSTKDPVTSPRSNSIPNFGTLSGGPLARARRI